MRILKGLSSRLLPCGCVAGVYETYDGEVVTLLDERSRECTDRTHENGNRIPDLAKPHDVHPTTAHTNRSR
jgi:hypothetical protein